MLRVRVEIWVQGFRLEASFLGVQAFSEGCRASSSGISSLAAPVYSPGLLF